MNEEIDYNNMTPEQKKIWVKSEIARKRSYFRGETPRNGLSKELTMQFSRLASELSPENLHEDGEISKAAAQKKYHAIMKEWAELEKQAGRKVTSEEFPY